MINARQSKLHRSHQLCAIFTGLREVWDRDSVILALFSDRLDDAPEKKRYNGNNNKLKQGYPLLVVSKLNTCIL